MGLRDELMADIAEVFDTDLADVVSSLTGSRFEPTGPADPISQTQPGNTVTYIGRGVFGSFGIQVSEALNILRTDIKLTCLQAEVSNTPKIDDMIERGGVKYKIINVAADPASVSWSLQIRRV
ncbi:hypothetical protein JQS35_11020 [Alcaligenes faecalis subsp. faecalis]|uniref:hypothetical protein n=1 Tax=Alcaligenes faecalis TaxID=511 RepID=UPI001F2CC2DD|nr:hypothetical protein [Alcaligenes faecalis]MBW4789130.1 hypothetical protein [Alcaligenes faecalis subsp. faecalis]